MSIKRGALIVLEGVDRSGKSTQSKLLVKSLNNLNVKAELMVFPDRTTLTGKLINQYLSDANCKLHDKAIHLLFSANRWENYDRITNLIKGGTTIVMDRYSFSGIAYSASKKDMDIEWCKTQEIGLPKPDKVFLLTLTKDQMNKRPGFGDERYENEHMQNRVIHAYQSLADESWTTLNAGTTIEEVQKELLNISMSIIKNVGNSKIGDLNFTNISDKENRQNGHNLIDDLLP